MNKTPALYKGELYDELLGLLKQSGFLQVESNTNQLLFDLKLISAFPSVGKVKLHTVIDPETNHVRVTLLSIDSTFKRTDNLTIGLSIYVLLDTDLTPEGVTEMSALCRMFSTMSN